MQIVSDVTGAVQELPRETIGAMLTWRLSQPAWCSEIIHGIQQPLLLSLMQALTRPMPISTGFFANCTRLPVLNSSVWLTCRRDRWRLSQLLSDRMQKPPERRSGNCAQILIIGMLSVLLALLIVLTVLIVSGSLGMISWPESVNTIFVSIVIPDPGVIIALAQWLHALSSEKRQEQRRHRESETETATSSVARNVSGQSGLFAIQQVAQEKRDSMDDASGARAGQIDLGEAPHVEHFRGRLDELRVLQQWIVHDRCRLISVVGMGGIGKTSLVAKLVDQNLAVFELVFWRSLLNAPSPQRILEECLQFLARAQRKEVRQESEVQVRHLLELLRERRCLIILDNAEAILQSGSALGAYKEGYEEYEKLIRIVGEARHQSCVIVTSREQFKEITWLSMAKRDVRAYHVKGLHVDDVRTILQERGLAGEEPSWLALVKRFAGNPMMLTFISSIIHESYDGLIAHYLADPGEVPLDEYPDLRLLLDSQFARLSHLEQQVIYWLAIEREAVSLQNLCTDVLPAVSKGQMLHALEALRRRSWIEQGGSGRSTLQPAVMDAVIERFNTLLVEEILAGEPRLLASHALLKAQAKDYIRTSQFQLILNVIAQRLLATTGRAELVALFEQRLAVLRTLAERPADYEAGNILNLLVQMGVDLRGYDFSHLVIRQAYLQETHLQDVDFSGACLQTSLFMDTFGSILSIAFSSRSAVVAAGTSMGEVRLWQAATGLSLHTLRGHTDWITSVALSPDGDMVASGSEDQTVRLWEVSSGQCLRVLQGHSHWVRAVAFSPDGRTLLSGSVDRTVRVWEVSDGRCLQIFRGHSSAVTSVACSPAGKAFASASQDQTIRLWEVGSSKHLLILHGHAGTVSSVAYSPDGRTLLSGGFDRTVRLWEVATGRCVSVLRGHRGAVRSAVFSGDGLLVASGSEDRTVRLWEVASGQCFHVLHGHHHWVRSVALSADSQLVASGSVDQTIRLWEANTGRCINTLHGHSQWITSVAFRPDGRMLASGVSDQTIHLWDVDSQQCLQVLHGHSHWVRAVAFSPDGRTLLSGGEDREARLWEVRSGRCLHVLRGHSHWIPSVALSADGRIAASGSQDRTVRLWEVSSGRCLSVLRGHTHTVTSVVFHPQDPLVVTGSQDRTVRLWEARSGRCLHVLRGHTNAIRALALDPDGGRLVSSGEDRTVRIWDVHSGQCLRTLPGHTETISSLSFSPDGKTFVSGGQDRMVRLWDVNSGQCLAVFHGHTHWVRAVTFSPDGRTFASGCYDGTIKVWERERAACLCTLRSDRPYERMNITRVQGLTDAQKAALKELGAREEQGAL
ncbi:MAG TPA: NB-ARC domain-containing protein [Ktedonobacteraceae bacterium]|jgi:WD40 repeat protein